MSHVLLRGFGGRNGLLAWETLEEFDRETQQIVEQTCFDRVCLEGTSFDVLGRYVHEQVSPESRRCP